MMAMTQCISCDIYECYRHINGAYSIHKCHHSKTHNIITADKSKQHNKHMTSHILQVVQHIKILSYPVRGNHFRGGTWRYHTGCTNCTSSYCGCWIGKYCGGSGIIHCSIICLCSVSVRVLNNIARRVDVYARDKQVKILCAWKNTIFCIPHAHSNVHLQIQ